MKHPLLHQALARPDARFITARGREQSFSETLRAARGWAATYDRAGAAPGSRIAIVGENSLEWANAALGAWILGATLVPLNARLPFGDLSGLISEVQPDVVVTPGVFAEVSYSDAPQLAAATSHGELQLPAWELDSIATIFFTSGTTGRPKPVPHSWRQLAASASASAFNLGVVPSDSWLCVLPLFHVGGLSILIRSLLYGTEVGLHDSFDLGRVFAALEQGATLASFVPTMLHRVLSDSRSASLNASSLRGILLGGGPASIELLERAAEHDLPVFQTYGMTEAASQITTMPPGCARGRVGSAGLPVFGADVEIRSDDGDALPADESGNIWARGPMMTHGYLDRPEANATLFRDGWFHTGDFGYLDDEGFLWVETRREDLILSGGENVYPAEVESVLSEAPGVDEVAVVGQPDAEWGQVVTAFVVGTATATDLADWARDRLAGHQLPRRWEFVPELPRTASGKVKRALLRDQVSETAPRFTE